MPVKKSNYFTSFPSWYFILLAGLASIVTGIWMIIKPVESYLTLSIWLAGCLFFTGLAEVLFSMISSLDFRGWGWLLAGALLDLFTGLYLLYYPMLTMIVLPIVIGIWLLLRGVIGISNPEALQSTPGRKWRRGISILIIFLMLAVSIVLIAYPFTGVFTVVIWNGIAFVLAGLFRVLLASKIRKASELRG